MADNTIYDSPICDTVELETLQMITASAGNDITVDNPFGGEELLF